MKKILLFVILCLVATPTFSEPRHGWGWGGGHSRPHYRQPNPEAFWGGVLGGVLTQWWQANRPGREVADEMVPGSREWFDFCTRRYRSFDPETGTYLGYDGIRHKC